MLFGCQAVERREREKLTQFERGQKIRERERGRNRSATDHRKNF